MTNESPARQSDIPWLFPVAIAAAIGVAFLNQRREPPPPAPSSPAEKFFRRTVARPTEVFAGPIRQLDSPDRLWACSQFPAGNDRTMQFLAWADNRSFASCSMKLTPHGDCIELDVNPCWPVNDEELEVISHLPRLKSISIYAPDLSEQGLSALHRLPDLRTIVLYGTTPASRSLYREFQFQLPNVLFHID